MAASRIDPLPALEASGAGDSTDKEIDVDRSKLWKPGFGDWMIRIGVVAMMAFGVAVLALLGSLAIWGVVAIWRELL